MFNFILGASLQPDITPKNLNKTFFTLGGASSDYLIDIGPKAGLNGGEIMFQGRPKTCGGETLDECNKIVLTLSKYNIFSMPEKRGLL